MHVTSQPPCPASINCFRRQLCYEKRHLCDVHFGSFLKRHFLILRGPRDIGLALLLPILGCILPLVHKATWWLNSWFYSFRDGKLFYSPRCLSVVVTKPSESVRPSYFRIKLSRIFKSNYNIIWWWWFGTETMGKIILPQFIFNYWVRFCWSDCEEDFLAKFQYLWGVLSRTLPSGFFYLLSCLKQDLFISSTSIYGEGHDSKKTTRWKWSHGAILVFFIRSSWRHQRTS